MELRQLRYFLSVADNRSFVSASAALYISRQAVSKAISQLEAELGVDLFVRDTSGAFLTPAGLQFYERIRSVVMELDSIAQQMRSSSNRYLQRIRIAFSVGTVHLVEDTLLTYRNTKENLELMYSEYPEEECVRMLLEHQVDMMVSVRQIQNPQFISYEIMRSRLGLLIRNQEDVSELDSVDLNDLSWLPIAVQSDKQVLDFCNKHQIKPMYQGQDFHRLFSLTSSGKCGLLLPECLIPQTVSNVCWIPLQQKEYWYLYCAHPQLAETDLLYSSVLEEINQKIISKVSGKG